jgi:hypothetical protein
MFDITAYAAEETSTLLLVNGNDEPLLGEGNKQCSITLYGPGSDQYAAAEARKNAALSARIMKKGKTNVVSTPEETAEFLAACTKSFNHFAYPGDFKADPQGMFHACYLDAKLGFIRDQASEHIRDWANFTKGLAKS